MDVNAAEKTKEGIAIYAAEEISSEISPEILQYGGGAGDVSLVDYSAESYYAELKRRIKEAILAYESDVYVDDLNIPYTDEDSPKISAMLDMIVREIKYENPYLVYAFRYDLLWWSRDLETGEFIVTMIHMTWDVGFRELVGEDKGDEVFNTYRVVPEKVAAYRTEVEKALSHVKSGMSTLEKILVLHDYLVLNCEYGYEHFINTEWYDEERSAYGAMVNKIAQSEGYACAFENLMQHIGVDCLRLSYNTHTNWNMVFVDGNWYHIDTAYDDPVHYTRKSIHVVEAFDDFDKEGYVSHRYFLVSDSEMDALDAETNVGDSLWGGPSFGHGKKTIVNLGYAIPEASNDGAYEGYIFRESALDTTVTYYNGEWYYIPGAVSGTKADYITKSKIDGSGATVLEDLGYANFVQVEGEYLYYSRQEDLYTDGIYAAKLGGSLKPERLMTMVGSKAYYKYRVEEFAVRDNIAAIVLCQAIPYYDQEKWVRLQYDINRREKTSMPTLKVVSGQLNYPDGFEEEEKEEVSTYLRYADGGMIPVTCNTSDIEATWAVAEGVMAGKGDKLDPLGFATRAEGRR